MEQILFCTNVVLISIYSGLQLEPLITPLWLCISSHIHVFSDNIIALHAVKSLQSTPLYEVNPAVKSLKALTYVC